MALRIDDRAALAGGVIRTFRLQRPERRNALSPELLDRLLQVIQESERDPELRGLVFTGEGRAFCSGYDLGHPLAGEAPDFRVVKTMAALRACRIPTLAQINGHTFGAGLELAASCDLRIAVSSAAFGLPPGKLGIAYAPGGLARFESLIGSAALRRLLFTGQSVDAAAALSMGLVDELVPDLERLELRAAELSEQIASMAPLALRAMKRTLNAFEKTLSAEDLEVAEEERRQCFESEDAKEGVAAFLERRAPRFRGK